MNFKMLLILVVIITVCLDKAYAPVPKRNAILWSKSSKTSKDPEDDKTSLLANDNETSNDDNKKGKGKMKETSSTDPDKYPEPLIHLPYQRNDQTTTPIKNEVKRKPVLTEPNKSKSGSWKTGYPPSLVS